MVKFFWLKIFLISTGICILSVGIVVVGLFFAIELSSGEGYTLEQIKECECVRGFENCGGVSSGISDETGTTFIFKPDKTKSPEMQKQFEECYSKIKNSLEYKKCRQSEDKCLYDTAKETERYLDYRNIAGIVFILGLGLIVVGALLFVSHRYISFGFIVGGILVILLSLLFIFVAPLSIVHSYDWFYNISFYEAFSWFWGK